MSENQPLSGEESFSDKALRALRRASADAIERARVFETPLVYARDGKVVEVNPQDLLRENPNLIRELMGNDDLPVAHWGPLPRKQNKPVTND